MRAFITTGFLLCLLASYVFSDLTDNCLSYRIEARKFFHVDTLTGAKNLLSFNGEVLARPYRGSNHVWSFNLRNPEIFLDREKYSERFDLNRCPSFGPAATVTLLPSLMIFDSNGLLKEMRVDKRESDLMTNGKLYIASLFQVNLNALKESVSSDKKELLYFGDCPATYEVTSDAYKTSENLRVVKKWQFDQCDFHKHPVQNEEHVHEYKSESNATQITLLRRWMGTVIPELILWRFSLTSENELNIDVDIRVILQNTKECGGTPNFVNTDAKVVNRQNLRPVDHKLISHEGFYHNSDLAQLYGKFAGVGPAANLYLDVYERAHKCWDLLA